MRSMQISTRDLDNTRRYVGYLFDMELEADKRGLYEDTVQASTEALRLSRLLTRVNHQGVALVVPREVYPEIIKASDRYMSIIGVSD